MRKVYIDIATTGMNPALDRIVEIAAIEVINDKTTENDFRSYINPDTLHLCPAVEEVNGYGLEFLEDKPRFKEIAEPFARLIQGAELVCFGAGFDLVFLENEFARLGLASLDDHYLTLLDLRVLAKSVCPNQRINLVILFKQFGLNKANNHVVNKLSNVHQLVQLHQALLSL
ncbi:MAG: exonuclease domain-containing protein [Methylotenera sp.]|nr:exonuclease domain-containing protein [Methylotenera sp.]MDO9233624.1 exonuclease domain-containing protein [Methylotenera sp.]MDP2101052.1 exonuclease domain-containing protein [Methylotenera sp.]MDP2281841.1 exonuclease domain-containing protein [Methylotenera sp.]MDP2403737.1 exonuclease domain-containing protein [Methylotenera sp.]